MAAKINISGISVTPSNTVDGDGAEAGRLADALTLPEDVRARDLAGACRQEVVGHEPDDHDRIQAGGRDFLDRPEQVLPADRAHQEAGEIDRKRESCEPPVGVLEGLFHLGERAPITPDEPAHEDGRDAHA